MMPKVMIGLVSDSGPLRGKLQAGVLVEPTRKEIERVARNKLRLGKKFELELFLQEREGGGSKSKVRLRLEGDAFDSMLHKGCVVVAAPAEKEKQRRPSAIEPEPEEPFLSFPCPPFPRRAARVGPLAMQEGRDAAMAAMIGPFVGTETKRVEPSAQVDPTAHACEMRMCGPWPVLDGDVRTAVRAAIAGCDGAPGSSATFIEKLCDGYIAFDYRDARNMQEVFPDPELAGTRSEQRWLRACRRECRGLLVCARTGVVLARRFPKFFNIGELPETAPERIDLSQGFTLSEKLDGSLVSPLLLCAGKDLRWATKSQIVSAVAEFVARVECDYETFARVWIGRGYTPLFEWCDTGVLVGAIEHLTQRLVLLAVRHREDGHCLSVSELTAAAAEYDIPLVQQPLKSELSLTSSASVEDVMAAAAGMDGEEGLVLSLADGRMFKAKSDWYVKCASAQRRGGRGNTNFLLELLRGNEHTQGRPTLEAVPEYAVWQAVLAENADDIVAHCRNTLQLAQATADAERMATFAEAVNHSIDDLCQQLVAWGHALNEAIPDAKRRFVAAERCAHTSGWRLNLLVSFALGNIKGGEQAVLAEIRRLAQSRNTTALVELLHVSWQGQNGKIEVPTPAGDLAQRAHDLSVPERGILVLDLGSFDSAPAVLRDHVLDQYLPIKLAKYMGLRVNVRARKHDITDETPIHITSDYSPSEGKLPGLWESFRKLGIVDLRVDLQPRRDAGFDDHVGDRNYANIAVQFGANSSLKKSSKARPGGSTGAFAGVLLETGVDFQYKDVREAMAISFASSRYVCLTSTPDKPVVPGNGDAVTELTHDRPKLRIFCDLDGVLADFEQGIVDIAGRGTDTMSSKEVWKHVRANREFFADLGWAPGGEELWMAILQHTSQGGPAPCILTGLPNGKSFGSQTRQQKKKWCAKWLGEQIEVITLTSMDKHRHSAKGHVLIDDRAELRHAWEKAGGTFIHHTSTANSIKLLGMLYRSSYGVMSQTTETALPQPHKAMTSFASDQHSIVTVAGQAGYPELSDTISNVDTEVVAFDVEWLPDDMPPVISKKRAAALLQLAFSTGQVFLVDLLDMTATTEQLLMDMLQNKSVIKLGFGIAEDRGRLGINCVWRSVLDLQEALPTLVNVGMDRKPSLATGLEVVCAMKMDKRKSVQASNWELRPLSEQQKIYAATDATAVLTLYTALCEKDAEADIDAWITTLPEMSKRERKHFAQRSSESIRKSASAETKQARHIGESMGAVSADFAAIFLSAQSRQLLLQAFPSLKFSNTHADHVTLEYQPVVSVGADQKRRLGHNLLPVGSECELQISGLFQDEQVQTVAVVVSSLKLPGDQCDDAAVLIEEVNAQKNGNRLHCTIRTAAGVPPADSIRLLRDGKLLPEARDLRLVGVVGLRVSAEQALRLPERERAQAEELAANGQLGESLRFKPQALSSAERFAMHQLADALGLQSRSEGKEENRYLALTVTRAAINMRDDVELAQEDTGRIFGHASELDEVGEHRVSTRKDHGKRQYAVVKDPAVFEALQFASVLVAQRKEVSVEAEGCTGSLVVDSSTGDTSIVWNSTSCFTPAQELFRRRVEEGDAHDSAQQLVVLLRGLPGAGKSTIATILSEVDRETVVCSADAFFEEGAGKLRRRAMKGMTAQEVYRSCFDSNLLPQAHRQCHERFCAALVGGSTTIVVDNTNTCHAEYSKYIDLAEAAGVPIAVVELQCDSLGELQRRGQHQVPADVVRRMLARWETYPEAIRLRSHSTTNAVMVTTGPGSALGVRAWLEHHHCYHLNHARPRTHLQFSLGSQPLSFVTIHPSRNEEFLALYAAELDARRQGQPENKLYLAEVREDQFRFFIDLDVESYQPLSENDLTVVVKTLQKLIYKSFGLWTAVLVTGAAPEDVGGRTKTGRHLHCPSLVVGIDTAQRLRSELVASLSLGVEGERLERRKNKQKGDSGAAIALDDQSVDWGAAVDAAMYRPSGATLRMLGSRKVKKDRDLGSERIHQLLAVFGRDGSSDATAMERYESNTVSLLRDLSIRSLDRHAETAATGVALVRTRSAKERARRVAAETEDRGARGDDGGQGDGD